MKCPLEPPSDDEGSDTTTHAGEIFPLPPTLTCLVIPRYSSCGCAGTCLSNGGRSRFSGTFDAFIRYLSEFISPVKSKDGKTSSLAELASPYIAITQIPQKYQSLNGENQYLRHRFAELELFKESLTNNALESEKKHHKINASELDTCEMFTQTGVDLEDIPTIHKLTHNPSKDVIHKTTQTEGP